MQVDTWLNKTYLPKANNTSPLAGAGSIANQKLTNAARTTSYVYNATAAKLVNAVAAKSNLTRRVCSCGKGRESQNTRGAPFSSPLPPPCPPPQHGDRPVQALSENTTQTGHTPPHATACLTPRSLRKGFVSFLPFPCPVPSSFFFLSTLFFSFVPNTH